MKVLVFGGGAVGLGLASCLVKSGHSPDIIARGATAEALREKGIRRVGILGDETFHGFRAFPHLSEIPERAPYDIVLFCIKSNNSREAAELFSGARHLYDSRTKLVLCQNGWGNREIFTEFFPSGQVFNARIITGFSRPESHCVNITVHVAPITIGHLDNNDAEGLAPFCRALSEGGLSCETSAGLAKDLWAKMLFNCSLNSLGAIFKVPYGELGKSDHSLEIIRGIVGEMFQVMEAAGYTTYWEGPDDYYRVLVDELIPTTAMHESSTLQDIRAGKPTEIQALTGAVVTLGEKHRVDVPVNRTVLDMIRFMEGQS